MARTLSSSRCVKYARLGKLSIWDLRISRDTKVEEVFGKRKGINNGGREREEEEECWGKMDQCRIHMYMS